MGRIFALPPSPYEVDHAAAIMAGVRYQAEHGVLPDAPAWRMLERRHDLNPVRFTHYHPNLAAILDGLTLPPPRAPHYGWAGHMRGRPTLAPLTVQPEPPSAATPVPEPASAAMWFLGLAVAFFLIGVANRRRVLPEARRWLDRIDGGGDGRTLVEALDDLGYRLASEGRHAKAAHVRDTIAIVQAAEARAMGRSEAR